MCFCETDVVNIMIHLKTRQRYPGVKFHESTLARVAREFGIRQSTEIKRMSAAELSRLTSQVLSYLPPEACPPVRVSESAVA